MLKDGGVVSPEILTSDRRGRTWHWLGAEVLDEWCQDQQLVNNVETVFVPAGQKQTLVWDHSNRVVHGKLAAGAQLTLVILDGGIREPALTTNRICDWQLAESARLQIIGLTRLTQLAHQRERWRVDLQGDQSELRVDWGSDLAAARWENDWHIIHRGQRTRSHWHGRVILRDEAVKIWRGCLDLRVGSVDSAAREQEEVLVLGQPQTNRSLPIVLSAQASAQGEHQVSSGGVSEEVTAYLLSRGWSRLQIGELIAASKLDSVIELIDNQTLQERAAQLYGKSR